MPWFRPDRRLARWCRAGFFLALAAVPVLFLLTGSVLPRPAVNDTLAHGFAYAVLASLSLFGFGPRRGGWACLGLFLLGLAVEVIQDLYAPGHGAAWNDVVANAGGIATGIALAGLIDRGRALRRRVSGQA